MVVSTTDSRETQRNAKESIFKCFDRLKVGNVAKRAKFGSSLVKNLAESSEVGYVLKFPYVVLPILFLLQDAELSYALKRLVRGLGASQEPVRRGYYGMLVVILRIAPHLTVKDVLDVMDKELHTSGNSSKGVSY